VTYVGVTGTRHEPTTRQAGVLGIELCQQLRAGVRLGHGDALGVDALSHDLAFGLGYWIDVHPPLADTWRAFKIGNHAHERASYAVRDARLVTMSDRLLALPFAPEAESPRSGTWLTVRFARRKGIPIRIIWADGSTTDEGTWR
jgi:hypothetical protein